MLAIIPTILRELPEQWRRIVADRRALTAIDPAADAFEKAAKELDAALAKAEDTNRMVPAREFAELRGVRPGTVRKWCARGLIPNAMKNPSGDWLVPLSANRLRPRGRAQ
jgi:hypothetical protein